MIRRILIILILLALSFVVYRFVKPAGADKLIENIQELSTKLFGEKSSSDGDKLDLVVTGTVLHINTGNGDINTDIDVFDGTSSGDNADNNDMVDLLLDDGSVDGEEAISIGTQDTKDEPKKEVKIKVKEPVVDTGKESIVDTGKEEVKVKIEEPEIIKTGDIKSVCSVAGDIISITDGEKCCEELNWIEYRPGLKAVAGVLCFDMKKGIPACKYVDTEREGWYYMDGSLLKKDLECGEYFASTVKTYITNTTTTNITTDVDQTDTILKDIVN